MTRLRRKQLEIDGNSSTVQLAALHVDQLIGAHAYCINAASICGVWLPCATNRTYIAPSLEAMSTSDIQHPVSPQSLVSFTSLTGFVYWAERSEAKRAGEASSLNLPSLGSFVEGAKLMFTNRSFWHLFRWNKLIILITGIVSQRGCGRD